MKNTNIFLYILFTIFFDGLTEIVNKIKKINKLSSVKTPSKLRQIAKSMTGKRNFTGILVNFLTEYNYLNYSML